MTRDLAGDAKVLHALQRCSILCTSPMQLTRSFEVRPNGHSFKLRMMLPEAKFAASNDVLKSLAHYFIVQAQCVLLQSRANSDL
eukprot:3456814-Amphidinium_carterae.2